MYFCVVHMKEAIKKYPFKKELKLGFEVIDLAKGLKSSKKLMTVPHRAQFYHILWIERGTGTHFVDFKPVPISDNTLLFIPHNSVNQYDAKGHYQGKAIIFTDRFFCKNEHDHQFLQATVLFSDLYAITQLRTDPMASDLMLFFNAMQTEYLRPPDHAQFQILHNLLHLFLLQSERELIRQGFEALKPSTNLDYLLHFKKLLEKDYAQTKSVKLYANAMNISEKQLHKATTTLLDKTPKKIIDERILLEAKRLLVHSTLTVKEVAYQLGFDEPTNFIKYFRKHTNTTPAEFRDLY